MLELSPTVKVLSLWAFFFSCKIVTWNKVAKVLYLEDASANGYFHHSTSLFSFSKPDLQSHLLAQITSVLNIKIFFGSQWTLSYNATHMIYFQEINHVRCMIIYVSRHGHGWNSRSTIHQSNGEKKKKRFGKNVIKNFFCQNHINTSKVQSIHSKAQS